MTYLFAVYTRRVLYGFSALIMSCELLATGQRVPRHVSVCREWHAAAAVVLREWHILRITERYSDRHIDRSLPVDVVEEEVVRSGTKIFLLNRGRHAKAVHPGN